EHAASIDAFRQGLAHFGLQPTADQLQSVLLKLDKAGVGGVTMKQLDKGMKEACKLAAKPEEGGEGQPESPRNTPRSPRKSAFSRAVNKVLIGNAVISAGSGNLTARERRDLTAQLNRARQEPLEAMTLCDEVLCKVKGMLNRRKVRMIDLFRVVDQSCDGLVSREELRTGLVKIGAVTSDEEFEALADGLDKDKSGDISIKEFHKAVRLAEQKARAEGKTQDLDTWQMPADLQDEPVPYDWHSRTVFLDGTENNSPKARGSVPRLSLTAASRELSGMQSAVRSSIFATSDYSWHPASFGPMHAAMSAKIGCGSLQDASITRQRLLDNTWASRPPTLDRLELPTHKKSVFRCAIFEGRFGAEPTELPSETMTKSVDRCVTAARSRFQQPFDGGIKKFPNSPMMQSEVMLGRAMNDSGSKFSKEFTDMYKGAHGMASWQRR
ncbi:unnamed protein product, partial [Polarella glacialis]